MTQISCNCIICAKEFNSDELHSVALSEINVTKFKICQDCFYLSDPDDNYCQAREIVNSYLQYTEAKQLFTEAKEILNSRKNLK